MFSLAAAGMICLSGCASGSPLPHDDQIHPDMNDAYISELFYRNDLGTTAPDPCVIEITDEESSEYGYYYLYGTTDPDMGFRAYRNKDLTGEWEDVTPEKNFLAFEAGRNHYAYGHGAFWAPEVIYDEEDGKYYMFHGGAITEGHRMIGVAVADEPYGPFIAVKNHKNKEAPLFDNDVMMAYMQEMGLQDSGVFNCIDAHPFVASDGAKYLYFVHELSEGNGKSDIFAVRMNTWTSPDLSTLTRVTRCNYYTVDGAYKDAEGSNQPAYEAGNNINEGPYVVERKQADGSSIFFLAFSVNGYTDKSYSVVQAIATSPLGPFRKLTEEEGGILLSTDWQKFDHVSGTGHNSFVTVGDEMYIVYHEHVARETGGTGPRDVAVDRIVWTKNADGMEVMYCNGPTWSLQPRISKYSGYTNLAPEATVTASGGENVSALTDGLLSIYSNISYVKEFEANKTVTLTFTFEGYRELSAVMVYNSKTFEKSFINIKRIEFDYKNENGEGMAYIEDLAFNWDFYKMSTVNEMRPGGSAVAVFNPLLCKEVRITVELPENRPEELAIMDEEGYFIKQESVAISEVVLLGKV